MAWKEPDNYDDWDAIAAALYQSIVISSLEGSAEWSGFEAIPKYDKRIASYANCSFLTAKDDSSASAFICFETEVAPFDTCLFGRLNESSAVINFERRKTNSANFVLAARSRGTVMTVDSLQVLL
jgi:hypothetical protein